MHYFAQTEAIYVGNGAPPHLLETYTDENGFKLALRVGVRLSSSGYVVDGLIHR